MNRLTLTLIIIVLTSWITLKAQHIFPEKFEGCNTERFDLERDTTTAKINSTEFIEQMKLHLGEKLLHKLKGQLRLQILVDLEGNSCLLSIENETNIKSKKMELKPWIDDNIKWDIPPKRVAALLVLDFIKQGVTYQRLGLDGNTGWHYLKD